MGFLDALPGIGSAVGTAAKLLGIGHDQAQTDWGNQKLVAKNQVQWRVEDAKKAGVSPLVALGMSPTNFAPSAIGDTGDDFAKLGSDIGVAASNLMSKPDKTAALLAALQVKRAGLENDLIAAQIRKLLQPGTGNGINITVNDPYASKTTQRGANQAAQSDFGNLVSDPLGLGQFVMDHGPKSDTPLIPPVKYWLKDVPSSALEWIVKNIPLM